MLGPYPIRLALVIAGALCAGAVGAQAPEQDPHANRPAAPAEENLPRQELDEAVLYGLLLGEIAAQRGNPGLAAETFVELARRTRDPRVARRAVEIAGAARLPDLALEAAEIWHRADRRSSRALQTLTALLVSSGRIEDAEPYLAQLLAAHGASTEGGFMQLGRLLGRHGDKVATLVVVRRLADAYPDMPQARFAVAQAALAAKDEPLALREIRRAAELKPDWEVAALFEAQILQRTVPQDAMRRLERFLEQYPGNREVRLSYARSLVLANRYPDARKQFETLLAAHPDNVDVIYAVALLAFQLKDFVTAETNMARLLELKYRDPDGARYMLGQIAEEQKSWERAIQWYRTIGVGEHYLNARMRIASAMAKLGKLPEARAFLRGADIAGEPQKVRLVVAEAQLLREANMLGEAFDMLADALQRIPDQPDLLYDLALTAEKLERFEVLEMHLRRLIQLRPDHAHAYNALGYSFADRNLRLDEARGLIERALELSPEDYFIVDSMGWVLFRQGNAERALGYLQRAYEGRPDAEIAAHLGEVLWTLGRRDEANRIWNEGLKNGPDNETLLKTLRRLRPGT